MSNPNYQISVNLLKLRAASVMKIKGKTTVVRCLVIPLEGISTLVEKETGIFLNMGSFGSDNLNFGHTHIVKASFLKAENDAMTEEQRRAIPILGNMKPMEAKQTAVPETNAVAEAEKEENEKDDLPF